MGTAAGHPPSLPAHGAAMRRVQHRRAPSVERPMPRYQHDPEGLRLPIKLDSTSNGEFVPVPLEPMHLHARNLAFANATLHAKQLGESRREFLVSLCGAATTL